MVSALTSSSEAVCYFYPSCIFFYCELLAVEQLCAACYVFFIFFFVQWIMSCETTSPCRKAILHK